MAVSAPPRPRFARSRAALAVALAPLLAAPLACQRVDWNATGDDGDWTPPDLPWWEDDDGDGGPDGDGENDGDDEARLDMPSSEPTAECALVDLLFVIDNSNSMAAEQQNLIASFDGFIAGIQANLGEVNDYHIGVVTTDDYQLNDSPCRELGALVTHSAAGSCGPFAAGRYISLADELAPAFTCIADVGGDGSKDERQVEALLRAVGPELAAPTACNAGFVRDDALLVAVLITDEDDAPSPIPGQNGSPGSPLSWFDELVAIKGGVETNVVVLALAGVLPPNACEPGSPTEGSQLTPRIENFVERFSFGEMGDVCADDYSGFFAASLATIAEACEGFTPVG